MPSSKRNRQEDDASAEKDKTNDAAPAKKKAVKSAAAEDVASADDLETSGTNPTPIFLKKTYKMIDSCDPSIATWSEDGLSFVVKDPDTFSAEIIPQYFDHNKLSSFARQLNFYGFRKIQTKPIKNADYDETTAKYVTFFNEKFRRGRQDLLREITRSTRSGGGGGASSSGGKDAEALRATVSTLEQRVAVLERKLAENVMELKGRVDLIVMELNASRQSQQQHPLIAAQMAAMGGGILSAMPSSSVASAPTAAGAPALPSSTLGDAAACTLQNVAQKSFGSGDTGTWEQQQPMLGSELARAFSSASARSTQQGADLARAASSGRAVSEGKAAPAEAGGKAEAPTADSNAPATLPPHPKQKMGLPQIPTDAQGDVAGTDAALALRNSLMLRNAWESDFFNNLMMAGADRVTAVNRAASIASLTNPALGPPGLMGYPPYAMGMLPPGMAVPPRDPSLAGSQPNAAAGSANAPPPPAAAAPNNNQKAV